MALQKQPITYQPPANMVDINKAPMVIQKPAKKAPQAVSRVGTSHDAAPGAPSTSKPATKSHAKKRRGNPLADHFIHQAIKRPGALTAAVGGPPGQNRAKVEALAANGTPLQKRQAAFYLNVLSKVRH